MKKISTLFFVLLLSACLLACGFEGSYDDGFNDGYDEGYFSALIEYEDDYARGYSAGYDEGYIEGYKDSKIYFALDEIEEAKEYAREKTGWSVYEAWNSIGLYEVDPSELTPDEYKACINTLVLFCDKLDRIVFYD